MTDNQKDKLAAYTDILRVLSQFRDERGGFDYRVGKALDTLCDAIDVTIKSIEAVQETGPVKLASLHCSDEEVPF